ncbi:MULTISPECIES: hypothetical protein [unclassified Pseudomonas]|uniref:hypothetical protein n=1 Tax=unclassified Pseudomonas TaxID=196821 RepID=UPI001CBEF0EC|nr:MULTISPECIES: hypothetical protein [unclassified Pseudomonas]
MAARYYRIPAGSRNLNYKKYFVGGEEDISELDDYTSHKAGLQDVSGIKVLLFKLDFIRGAVECLRL